MTAAQVSAPTATYRLQLQPGFGFAEAGRAAPYLARLGVSHLHLSPVLEAVTGSTHGYDVVDHSRVREEIGGEDGLRALAATARAHGLGLIVDAVPNHMAAPVPAHRNPAWWQLLREGPQAPTASWFDVDWAAGAGRILLPVLADRLGAELPHLKTDSWNGEPVLRYYDHAFPLRPGTEQLPLPELLDQQFYRLAWWRMARTQLNYRRFFTVSDLVGVRVEHPEVFRATHDVLLRLHAEGVVEGFRIDHPDGLADPRGYLARLAEATGGAYVVVEKILTADEELPRDWPCAGTTGYDALRRIDAVLTDAPGTAALTSVYADYLGSPVDGATAAARRGRTEMTAPEGALAAEVSRLTRLATAICADDAPELRDHPVWALRQAIAATLAAYPVYRPYPVPGEPDTPADIERTTGAAATARTLLPAHHAATADLVRDLALGRYGRSPAKDEFRIRLAQTASVVAAKGVEDTAFYRRYPLLSLNEVGGDPGSPGLSPAEFHAYCARMQRDHPAAMTVLSTHDTKRSADARARLTVLAELPDEWRAELAAWTKLLPAPDGDSNAAYLVFQTALAAWPIDADRLAATALKSVREAKLRTSWTSQEAGYERAVEDFARAVPDTPELAARITAFAAHLAPYERTNTLSAALLHLTMPGVPDLYQGSEHPLHTLVDPDNRHPVAFALASRGAGNCANTSQAPPAPEKLHVTATALHLRRTHPEAFTGPYTPLPTHDNAIAYLRGDDVLAVATRLPHRLEQTGWGGATLPLPPGQWTDALTEGPSRSGEIPLATLLAHLPVALLVRTPQEP